jgi:hypothetical protein
MTRARRLRSIVPPETPLLWDRRIDIRFHPSLTAGNGEEVHAASHMRRRLVLLDGALRRNRSELRRIAVHEAFHFAWLRLGNPDRLAFEQLLRAEYQRGARGELGWSAEIRKIGLTPSDVRNRSRAWREYVCESFCDTAAWLYAGVRRHPEFTLAPVFCRQRKHWFEHQSMKSPFLT